MSGITVIAQIVKDTKMSNNQIIKALQDELAKEQREVSYSYSGPNHHNCPGCCQIDSDYEKAVSLGHEVATARLLPMIKAAIEMATFYGDRDNYEFCDLPYPEVFTDEGKKARQFLAEFKKENELIINPLFENEDYLYPSPGRIEQEFLTTLADGESKKENE